MLTGLSLKLNGLSSKLRALADLTGENRKETSHETLIFLPILFSVISRPAVAEVTQDNVNKIHLIVKEATGPIYASVAVVKTEVNTSIRKSTTNLIASKRTSIDRAI